MTNYHSTPDQIVALIEETTLLGGGAPTTRLGAIKMGYWSPAGKNTPVTPSGNLVPTASIHGFESSQAPLAGQMTYGDLSYLFASNLCKAVGGAHAPSASGGDPFATYSIIAGDKTGSTGRYAYPGCYVDDLTLTFDREKTEVGGQMLGGLETPGATFGTLTKVPVVPVQPANCGLWVATSFGGSYSRVPGAFTAQVKIGNRRNQVKTLDDSVPSYTALTEKLLEGSAMIDLSVAADTSGADYAVAGLTLAKWRQGTPIFVAIKAAPSGHALTIICCAIIDTLKKKDLGGTLALDASCFLADDGADNWISASAS